MSANELVGYYAQLYHTLGLVADHFEGDYSKAKMWMDSDNPMLGGTSPIEMIKSGRHEKLMGFIETSIKENKSRPDQK